MTTTMICILTSVMLGVVGQLVLKYGMTRMGPLTPSLAAAPSIVLRIVTSPWVIFGLSCYVLGSFFWLIALSRVDLSFAYPFASMSYVLMLGSAWYFLGEAISLLRLGGVGLIILGVLVISQTGT